MIDNNSEAVRWIVDPGFFHGYKEQPILDFLEGIENWDKPIVPSSRYWQLKEKIHFWNGHHFYFGLSEETHADEFLEKWGGDKFPGRIVDNKFVNAIVDARGVAYEIGDEIAWASVTGRSAFVRTGRVTLLGKSGSVTAEVIESGSLGKWKNSGKATIKFPERALIIRKHNA